MTNINNFDDILDAMDADPRLAEALRERILTRELMQLPVVVQGMNGRLDALSNRTEEISNRVDALTNLVETLINLVETLTSQVEALFKVVETLANQVEALANALHQFISEQKATNIRLEQAIGELKTANVNLVSRMDRMEQDNSYLKNFATMTEARRYVESIADDMGLTYVRTLTTRDLIDLAADRLQGSARRSFIRADLVMEVVDDGQPAYAAVEVSYTTDARDTNRAIRNAGYIASFTDAPCYPGIVGVRKDRETAALIDAGTVRWSEIEDWNQPEVEGLS